MPPSAPYRERLVPGPGTVLACLLLAPAGLVVLLPVSLQAAVVAAVLLPSAVIGALVATAPVLAVEDGRFRAGRASIEVALTGEPVVATGLDARRERGVDLDARAWLVLRGWVDPVVRVPITDPDDPVPYWLVSSRRPDALVAALDAARAAAAAS